MKGAEGCDIPLFAPLLLYAAPVCDKCGALLEEGVPLFIKLVLEVWEAEAKSFPMLAAEATALVVPVSLRVLLAPFPSSCCSATPAVSLL